MAFQNIGTNGEPGLLFPFVAHSVETGVMQDDKDAAGGFVLWGKNGKPGQVWAARPQVPDTSGTKDDPDGFFAGIAQLTTGRDGYVAGDFVNVVKKGRIWVKVSAEVLAGKAAYVDGNGNISASTSGTAISGATFKSNASANGLAELEIA